MKELSFEEEKIIEGGNVPVSYYMDSDTIKANASVTKAVAEFVYGFLVGLID